MKKTLLLTSIIALGALSSKAQGYINADNVGTGVFILIQDISGVINGGAASKIGTPATAAGFIGAGPGQVQLSLYAAPDNIAHGNYTFLTSTTPIWTGYNANTTVGIFQGCVGPGSNFQLPTQTGFDGSVPVDFLFVGSVNLGGAGTWLTYSTLGVITPTTASVNNAANIWGNSISGTGISSMVFYNYVPEPSTIALGSLGAVALLLFRRRK